ncbi:hypothetical protein [Pelagibaculum spongiae]|uniref:Lipoprotein n=1 Tax=Pelagibaculum spongiae TaxID=2080658 RepID=A0A2V1GVN8_9GAMM|nr:hypothetical protein [Pelagibaculum spongiae]PVZ67727.1 hypothetical protein DC094_14940 [Pelagibaculum spongiae]
MDIKQKLVVPLFIALAIVCMSIATGCAEKLPPIPPSQVTGEAQQAACGQMIIGYSKLNFPKLGSASAQQREALITQAKRMKSVGDGKHTNAQLPAFLWGQSASEESFQAELKMCMDQYAQ